MKSNKRIITHAHLLDLASQLPTDYSDFGGKVERWSDAGKSYPDCSMGCKWAAWLEPPLGLDWCVCASPKGPRRGLLTFEHQAGDGCFEETVRRAMTKTPGEAET
jgi:hypothetical protein